MVVYLPIAFLKDWLCGVIKRRASKGTKTGESTGEFSPLKFAGGHFELEVQGALTRKDSEVDLSPLAEGKPLVPKHKDDLHGFKQERHLTTKEVARYGFYIAPIWFVTEVSAFIIAVKPFIVKHYDSLIAYFMNFHIAS